MSKPAYLYITADENRNLEIRVAKDLEVALVLDQEQAGKPLKIVFYEECATILHAHQRMQALVRSSKRRRARLVTRNNPKWVNLVPGAEWVGPGGGTIDALYRQVEYFRERREALERVARDSPEDDYGDSAGGVLARVPAGPVGPQEGADALAVPRS